MEQDTASEDVSHSVDQEISTFYGIRRFTRFRQWNLFWVRWIQSMSLHIIVVQCFLIFSSHLRSGPKWSPDLSCVWISSLPCLLHMSSNSFATKILVNLFYCIYVCAWNLYLYFGFRAVNNKPLGIRSRDNWKYSISISSAWNIAYTSKEKEYGNCAKVSGYVQQILRKVYT